MVWVVGVQDCTGGRVDCGLPAGFCLTWMYACVYDIGCLCVRSLGGVWQWENETNGWICG